MRTPSLLGAPPPTAARPKVAFVSTYLPRRCGIATFTKDLRGALEQVAPDLDLIVCPVDREQLVYGPEAAYVLRQDEPADYRTAAESLADAGVDVVVIQHEYGIFGGPDGEWIVHFAEELHARGVPYLVTLHTVLSLPSAGQTRALRRLCQGAFAVSVFTETARRLAVQTGVVPADRVVVVPHGAPTVLKPLAAGASAESCGSADIRPEAAHALARADGMRLLSTFGLISPGKGLETAIEAVAEIARTHPDVRYIIAGRTHPEVARRDGEAYRNRLMTLVADLGAENHVQFIDHFLTDAELAALLHRTEVFLTPYHSREQISSGALTFALAAGCAVVSTAYHYAADMLAGGAGLLVEPHDVQEFAAALDVLLAVPRRLDAARAAARKLGSTLSWPAVASRFAEVLRAAATAPSGAAAGRARSGVTAHLPGAVRLPSLPTLVSTG